MQNEEIEDYAPKKEIEPQKKHHHVQSHHEKDLLNKICIFALPSSKNSFIMVLFGFIYLFLKRLHLCVFKCF